MYKEAVLKNGLRVVVNHMPNMESAAVGLWIASGSRYEAEKVGGISHFLEHMVFKGTRTRSARKIKADIEGRGGSLNGFTSEEVTCYLAKVSGKHINIALDVLSDLVLNPLLNKGDIERERRVIMEEIRMYRDLPNHHVHDLLNALMWPNHPLGRNVLGTMESVGFIDQKKLFEYKRAVYSPENMILVFCGNVDYRDMIKRIGQIFEFKKRGFKKTPVLRYRKKQLTPQLNILYKETEQSHLSMGIRAFGSQHRDKYILSLLHVILGANMSSRLFENIREKRGLAYEIGTEVKRYKDTGAFLVNAGIEHKKVKQTISLIIKELKRIRQKPLSQRELRRAKDYFNVQLSLSLENTTTHMLWLGEHAVLTGELPDKNKIMDEVNLIETQDVQRVANTIFKGKNLNLALIGPKTEIEHREIKKELNL